MITPGIPDSEFIRGQVPMTKEEVRALSICKLRLSESPVVYDIGSGTGSVAVEIARLCKSGRVYAVETKSEACALIKQNIEKFGLENIRLVEGMAPAALEGLEAATHAFVGGSKGQFKEILAALLKINPRMRVVANAVSLESISDIQTVLKDFPVKNFECLQISVSRSEKAGNYHLMKAENPVYIFSFDLDGGDKA